LQEEQHILTNRKQGNGEKQILIDLIAGESCLPVRSRNWKMANVNTNNLPKEKSSGKV
jgi:hypothetical protein